MKHPPQVGRHPQWLRPGWGDRTHYALRPLTKAVQRLSGGRIDLARCGGCARRRRRLNAIGLYFQRVLGKLSGMRRLGVILALLPWFSVHAQTNVLIGQVADYGLTAQSNVAVRLTLLSPNPRIHEGVFVRRDPVVVRSDATGQFAFTNIIWGRYQLTLDGLYATTFALTVNTNTVGVVPIGGLATVGAPLPPNPATNYLTEAQTAVLFQSASANLTNWSMLSTNVLADLGGGGTGPHLWASSAAGIYPTGELGTSAGWVSTSEGIYPQ